MIGPNTAPTLAVPCRWNMNSATRMTLDTIGTTHGGICGVATAMPSTAPSTEMAGVMTPSP